MDSELLNEFLLQAFPNPERIGCPDEAVLKAFAEGRMALTDPVGMHIGSCSECYAEYRHYRLDWNELNSKSSSSAAISAKHLPSAFSWKPYALVACLLVIVGLIAGYAIHNRIPSPAVQVASNEPVKAVVDLFNVPTLRSANNDSAAAPLEQISLPASIVHLSITLPRFSQSGQYYIVVSQDRAGRQLIAKGAGTAIESGGKVLMDVTLDLRSAKAGAYFLATVRDSDNGTYYYPLKIK